MTAPTQAPESVFDSQEFYELMQAYRCAGIADLSATVANFEAVKDFCKLHAPQPTQAQPVGEWEKAEYGSYPVLKWSETYKAKIGEKLYDAPQPVIAPWVMLDDDELNDLWENTPDCAYAVNYDDQRKFAKIVLAAFIAKQGAAS